MREMTESIIVRLFESEGLGEVLFPIAPVSGGFLHRMYKVRTAMKSYAVKHLNPEIMRRPDAAENYRRAEKLEQIIAEAGIPVVPALMINGRKMLESDGEYFYVFPWQDGQITDWNHISALQCRQAGNIQGRIHALQPRRTARTDPVVSAVD